MNVTAVLIRKDETSMRKPTYRLWRNDFSSQEEYKAVKDLFASIGFCVVTYFDSNSDQDIHTGIKALIRNHIYQNRQQ